MGLFGFGWLPVRISRCFNHPARHLRPTAVRVGHARGDGVQHSHWVIESSTWQVGHAGGQSSLRQQVS